MDTNKTLDQMDQISDTANRLQETARQKLADVSSKVIEHSRSAANTTDAYVRHYAWSSVAAAALLGVVIGLMIRKS